MLLWVLGPKNNSVLGKPEDDVLHVQILQCMIDLVVSQVWSFGLSISGNFVGRDFFQWTNNPQEKQLQMSLIHALDGLNQRRHVLEVDVISTCEVQGGPQKPVLNGIITPINRFMTPVTHLFAAI